MSEGRFQFDSFKRLCKSEAPNIFMCKYGHALGVRTPGLCGCGCFETPLGFGCCREGRPDDASDPTISDSPPPPSCKLTALTSWTLRHAMYCKCKPELPVAGLSKLHLAPPNIQAKPYNPSNPAIFCAASNDPALQTFLLPLRSPTHHPTPPHPTPPPTPPKKKKTIGLCQVDHAQFLIFVPPTPTSATSKPPNQNTMQHTFHAKRTQLPASGLMMAYDVSSTPPRARATARRARARCVGDPW